jgi:hypothetical protein
MPAYQSIGGLIMSTLNPIDNITLNPDKNPSYALIMRMAGVAIAAGFKAIDINWRGQSIELTYNERAKKWSGLGSIAGESGSRIARELTDIHDFVQRHFAYIGIGHA